MESQALLGSKEVKCNIEDGEKRSIASLHIARLQNVQLSKAKKQGSEACPLSQKTGKEATPTYQSQAPDFRARNLTADQRRTPAMKSMKTQKHQRSEHWSRPLAYRLRRFSTPNPKNENYEET